MKSLQTMLEALYTDFTDLSCPVTHYRRLSKYPYLVWTEDREAYSLSGDNHKQEQAITGYIDYFTKTEFDPAVDQVQEILNSQNVAWSLDSVDYEDSTNLIHYRWLWETR